jgi:putative chitinase
MIDRKYFYDSVRVNLFDGNLSQSQVDGMNYLLDVWEREPLFGPGNPNDGTNWLAYAFATVYHETAYTMRPIEEYGKGSGHSYGAPTGPHNQCYYGRGHVQLTWEDNYKKGEEILKNKYHLDCSLHPEPDRMLEDEPSALVLFDGMIYGWFTGVSLQTYFSKAKGIEDSYNARRIINGTDKASTIQEYYYKFLNALI